MSAIPNLPEETKPTHPDSTNADAALRQLLETKNAQTNGVHNSLHTEETQWQLHSHPVENQRPIKVIIIGAGYSGIYLGIRVPEKLRNLSLVIYEKNAGVGGTWWENRYPGAACDVPSHSYQFSFDPKPDWSSLYAPSEEIRGYLQSMCRKYGADRFMKLEHRVVEAGWDQGRGKWKVKVEKADGSVFEDESDVLIGARGNLNTMQWPDVPGLESFEGELMHSASWNQEYDFRHKRIGLIGSGSSAIQILPKLQAQEGATLNAFIRNRTWISPPLAQQTQDQYGLDEFEFTPEMLQKFKEDPVAWEEFRKQLQFDANNIHAITIRGTEMQKGAQKFFADGMKERLKKRPDYFEWLRPSFSPGCRRLTPGPGFLEALVEDNVNFIREGIKRVEPKGVVTEDGKLHELDVLCCATGFRASTAPPFPVRGLEGKLLQDHWRDRATNYLSLATDAFPNYFIMLGPNAAIGEGSLTMMIESTGDYIVKAVRKLQKENIKSMTIKPERVRDFLQYCDEYFKGTVYSEECRSWYKKTPSGSSGSIVTGLWPGSSLHCIEALRSPRWEDFLYEYLPEENGARVNEMAWLGNGWAVKQLDEKPNMEALSFYVTPMFLERDIGIPSHPKPEENEQFVIRPWSY